MQFAEMIKECDDIVLPKVSYALIWKHVVLILLQYKLYVSLGVSVVLGEVLSEHRLPLLNEVNYICYDVIVWII